MIYFWFKLSNTENYISIYYLLNDYRIDLTNITVKQIVCLRRIFIYILIDSSYISYTCVYHRLGTSYTCAYHRLSTSYTCVYHRLSTSYTCVYHRLSTSYTCAYHRLSTRCSIFSFLCVALTVVRHFVPLCLSVFVCLSIYSFRLPLLCLPTFVMYVCCENNLELKVQKYRVVVFLFIASTCF
jgi:hypothetical protein